MDFHFSVALFFKGGALCAVLRGNLPLRPLQSGFDAKLRIRHMKVILYIVVLIFEDANLIETNFCLLFRWQLTGKEALVCMRLAAIVISLSLLQADDTLK